MFTAGVVGKRKRLAPSEKYEVYVSVLTRQATSARPPSGTAWIAPR
jgi:uncharacterized protein affecting Mg2+/Co2+ transport